VKLLNEDDGLQHAARMIRGALEPRLRETAYVLACEVVAASQVARQRTLEMLDFAIGRVIEKTRHHVRHRGYLYEVDVFGGMLAGLVVAELETPEDVPDEMLPAWLGREVTGESRFYNASLALGGIPEIAA